MLSFAVDIVVLLAATAMINTMTLLSRWTKWKSRQALLRWATAVIADCCKVRQSPTPSPYPFPCYCLPIRLYGWRHRCVPTMPAVSIANNRQIPLNYNTYFVPLDICSCCASLMSTRQLNPTNREMHFPNKYSLLRIIFRTYNVSSGLKTLFGGSRPHAHTQLHRNVLFCTDAETETYVKCRWTRNSEATGTQKCAIIARIEHDGKLFLFYIIIIPLLFRVYFTGIKAAQSRDLLRMYARVYKVKQVMSQLYR